MAKKIAKVDQSRKTRTALLTAARELFAEQGYAHTSTEEILERTGMTRGALYYHFRDKADLFRAVFCEVEDFMQQEIARSTIETEGDIWQRFRAGAITFFSLCTRPDIQRILYIDGPAVLNAETWRTTLTEAGIDIVRQNLRLLMDHGYIEELPLEALTYLWFGAYSEAAIYIARTEDKDAARMEIGRCVEHLAKGMRLQAQAKREKDPPRSFALAQDYPSEEESREETV